VSRWEAPGSLRVETVVYSLTSDNRDGLWYRVSRGGCGGRVSVCEERTLDEVAERLADLGIDLEEAA
jgi:hypothetical protein